MIVFHPREKRLPYNHTIETSIRGHETKPEGKRLQKCQKPLSSRGDPLLLQACPLGRAPFHAPRSPSLALAPGLSPVTPCAAVWGGRDAAAAWPVALGSAVFPRGA